MAAIGHFLRANQGGLCYKISMMNMANLPNDVDALKAIVMAQQDQNKRLEQSPVQSHLMVVFPISSSLGPQTQKTQNKHLFPLILDPSSL